MFVSCEAQDARDGMGCQVRVPDSMCVRNIRKL